MTEKNKVLVIDDSPIIFKTIKRALEPHGFEIVGHAENGQIGLEMIEKLIPDFITLDVTMPVMDGLETAENIKKKDPSTLSKVIMLSAMGDDDILQTAKGIGIKNFLSKPFKPEDLLDAIKNIG